MQEDFRKGGSLEQEAISHLWFSCPFSSSTRPPSTPPHRLALCTCTHVIHCDPRKASEFTWESPSFLQTLTNILSVPMRILEIEHNWPSQMPTQFGSSQLQPDAGNGLYEHCCLLPLWKQIRRQGHAHSLFGRWSQDAPGAEYGSNLKKGSKPWIWEKSVQPDLNRTGTLAEYEEYPQSHPTLGVR